MRASGAGDVEELLRAGLARLTAYGSVLCLASDHETGLATALERLGFEPEGSYVVMAKRLVKPVRELVPETAGTAIPVN